MKRGRSILWLMILIIILALVWWFFIRSQSPPVVTCSDNTTNNPLPPENCRGDWLTAATFDRTLNDLPASVCPNPLLNAVPGQCTVRTYEDINGEKFTVTVEGADPAVVQAYLENARPYFLAQEVAPGVTLPLALNPPDLATILVESVEFTPPVEDPRQILRKYREILIETQGGDRESVNLRDVLLYMAVGEQRPITMTPDEVLEVAIARAKDEFTTANAATGLPQEVLDGLASAIPQEMNALMDEPGAAFLNDPDTVPHDEASYRDTLSNDRLVLVVTLNWERAPTGKSRLEELLRFLPNLRRSERQEAAPLGVVWYAIDPWVDPYRGVYYKWQCGVSSASTRIQSFGGRMTNYFEQLSPYYYYIGSRIADSQGVAFPDGMVRYAYGNYNTYVIGGPNGGSYYLYGGWIQGYGC